MFGFVPLPNLRADTWGSVIVWYGWVYCRFSHSVQCAALIGTLRWVGFIAPYRVAPVVHLSVRVAKVGYVVG